MIRWLIRAAAMLIAASPLASTYPAGVNVSLTRFYPEGSQELMAPVRIFTYIEVNEPGPLSCFYYSEQLPLWIQVHPDLITVNGENRSYTMETGAMGEVLEGLVPYRWIIDDPTEGGSVLQQGDQVLISYLLYGSQDGVLVAQHEGWFASLPPADLEAVFGGDDAPMVIHFSDAIAAPASAARAIALHPAYPNPFNPKTRLTFDNDTERPLRLDILDIQGRPVRHLADEVFAEGQHEVTWDGRDDQGVSLPSGAYLARLSSDEGHHQSQKLLLLK